MTQSTLRTGAAIAGLSAVALFVVMFAFDWYGVDEIELTQNAWDAYNRIDIGLVVVGVVGLAFGLVGFLSDSNIGRLAAVATALVGAVGFIVIAIRAASPPDLAFRGRSVKDAGLDISPEIGVFLGLVAIGGIALGGLVAARAAGVTVRGALDALAAWTKDEQATGPSRGTGSQQ